MSRPPRLVIGVSGGSASGKTEIARAVARGAAPLSARVMAEDDYYGDHGGAPDFNAARFNFDHPEARDHDLLAAQLAALKAGREIAAPVYDFTTHRRRAETRTVAPADIVLVEGVHLFCSEDLRAALDLKVYVEAPDDVRLARRVLRDVAERGRDARSVVDQYLSTVRPMHHEWIAPGREHADIVIRNDAAAARPADHLEPLFDTLAGPVLEAVRRAEGGVRRAG